MSDENCIFCKIINGEIPAEKIYEDSDFLAFLDITPVNHGHTLLIPKQHYKNIFDIPDELISTIAPLIKKLSFAIKQSLGAGGINIAMNNDLVAGQLVFHAHIHIIPRFENDGHRHWGGKQYKNKEEIISISEKIKDALKKTA